MDVTEARAVALGTATMVRAALVIGLGDLSVAGGARELLEAHFSYNVRAWQPEVAYDVRDGVGQLSVRQPAGRGFPPVSDARNAWDLRFNGAVPLELGVKLGIGRNSLALGGLALSRLAVETGVGGATLDLTGAWHGDLDATVKGGVGRVTMRLPSTAGVRVETKRGLGAIAAPGFRQDGNVYLNDAYGAAPVTLRLAISSGVGAIGLVLDTAAI